MAWIDELQGLYSGGWGAMGQGQGCRGGRGKGRAVVGGHSYVHFAFVFT